MNSPSATVDATPPQAAAASTAGTLDHDNPWPGLAAYDESAQQYFNGRAGEIDELLRRVLDEPLTVLFGRSGLGKSSLLKAGLFPLLRERGFVPVYLRLQLHSQSPPLTTQVRLLLEEELRASSVEYPEWPADETLWAYLHRCELEFWDSTNRLVRPVLVFDQFEEVFTLGRQLPAEIERFRTELADLIENRVPASLHSRLDEAGAAALCIDFKAMPYKVVLSLREDFLADLENWRASIPSLRRNRMRLLPMHTANALQAIRNERTAHLVDEALARQIVSFLAASTGDDDLARAASAAVPAPEASDDSEIDPALLSLFCAGVNRRRQKAGKARFDAELIGAAKRTVVADFYRDCLADMPAATRKFIENELVSEQGYRNSFAVCDAFTHGFLTDAQLRALVDRRLLRRTHALGTDRIELTHDLLTRAVVHERDQRLKAEREAKQQRERRRMRIWAACAALAVLVSAGISYRFWQLVVEARQQRQQATSRQLAAMATREIGRDPELATWLAAEAFSSGETEQSREAIFDTAQFTWPKQKLAGADKLRGHPFAIAMSSSGRYLAVLAKPGDEGSAAGRAFVSLWDIEKAKPEAKWIRPVAVRDAARLALSGDRDTKMVVAVGGGNAIEMLDGDTGACVLRVAAPSRVRAMAFGGRSGPFFGWAGDRVHVLDSNPAMSGSTAAQTGCDEGEAAAGGVILPSMATLDVEETKELSLSTSVVDESKGPSSPRVKTVLLLQLRPTGQFELRRYVQDAGAWRQELRGLLMDCAAQTSMSLGSNRYSTTLSPATCAFSLGRGEGADLTVDKKFERTEPSDIRWVRNVVWARFGVAHLKVLGDGELEVSGPAIAGRWRVHLKAVDFPLRGPADEEPKNALALSGDGRRVAAMGAREKAVTVYSLEPRPFYSELAAGMFAVAPDASWIAVETKRRWAERDSTLTVFVRPTSKAAFQPAWTVKLASLPQGLAANEDGLVVSMAQDAGKQGSNERRGLAPPESDETARGGLAALQADKSMLDALRASGQPQTLERPASAGPGPGGPRRVVVRLADGRAAGGPTSNPPDRTGGDSPAGQPAAKSARAASDRGATSRAKECGKAQALSPQWLAIWNEAGVEVFDADCRGIGHYEIAGISGVGVEGGGKILRIDLDGNQRVMLVPLDRELTKAEGFSLSLRTTASPKELCGKARIDCDRAGR